MNDLWSIVCKINPADENSCQEVDGLLAENITYTEDVYAIYYYIPYQRFPDLFKKTANKIDQVALEYLNDLDAQISWYRLRSISQFFSTSTKEKMVERWLKEPSNDTIRYICDFIPRDKEIVITFLEKAVECYKKRKSYQNLGIIGDTFRGVSLGLLPKACKVVSSSTPAVTACLLSRNDIGDDYTLIGLKSISKLKARHSVQKTIKLDMLKDLGPRGRLDAIEHLTCEMINNKFVLLEPMPTKEELKEFLFPCALKYNDEVTKAIQNYELAIDQLRR